MNGYYGLPSEDPLRPLATSDDDIRLMTLMGTQGMDTPNVVGPQSLDDIVDQNAKAMRRGSLPSQYETNQQGLEPSMGAAMIDFNGSSVNQVPGVYQFGPQSANQNSMMRPSNYMQISAQTNPERRQSTGRLAVNPQYTEQGYPFSSMTSPASTYQSPLQTASANDLDVSANYVPSVPSMPMAYHDTALSAGMAPNLAQMSLYGQAHFTPQVVNSPLNPNYTGSPLPDPVPNARRGSLNRNETSSSVASLRTTRTGSLSQGMTSSSSPYGPQPRMFTPPIMGKLDVARPEAGPPADAAELQDFNSNRRAALSWTTVPGVFPPPMMKQPHSNSNFTNAYSVTGFDMLTVLMRVATRPNPQINIGAVDLSCAFVVCDAERYDMPIVYCSENFERLTGYNKHEILGQNCRFLQAPDGQVQAGVKRKYVDDDSVLYLKNMINSRKEAQTSMINYRKGGQPFMNLLTVIPVTWGTDEVKFFVGFQVDLVEQPNSVTSKNPDGSYQINYQRGLRMPRYVFNGPERISGTEAGQTISREDVSLVLSTIGSGESELSRRIWDKVLLENTDDVVHVLSLKGLFLYLSPSSRKVLEYETSELVGTALSSVCHPSDIVPITRELKETASGTSVDIVFRIRRKHSGYMWFEAHGSLHTEQGKGRKCIILVGRERPVYALSRSDVAADGGIGENELWTKMSTSGMFLFVPTNVRSTLDRQPEELVGTSIQALMRKDSKSEFGRALEIARTGKKASAKHEMINKRGQVLQAFSTVYPGDAIEGQKPTFVITQTRLLKYSRGNSQLQSRGDSVSATSQTQSSIGTSSMGPSGTALVPSCSISTASYQAAGSQYVSVGGDVITRAGHHGLTIGHQDVALASDDNVFDELKTTRSTSWQFELRQMEKRNRLLAEEVQSLIAAKKKRKRRKGAGQLQKDCANCHTRVTPEWRRGPSGNRDLCNSCGLRWAKQNGRISPRTSSHQSAHSVHSDKTDISRQSVQTHVPNRTEATGQEPVPSTNNPNSSNLPPRWDANNHPAKFARMDTRPCANTFGTYPPKIEETAEEFG